jgi:ABC-2 type transport system ATP-binding protein
VRLTPSDQNYREEDAHRRFRRPRDRRCVALAPAQENVMIEARNLTKRYGDTTAVDDLSFTVRPGIVTGFLGPNGAGKSTTMRMILGLDAPTSGSVTVNGKPYAEHRRPLREVGALLEARGVHTGRSARGHLLAMAATTGIGADRVEEVIEMVGLSTVARQRAGAFSLGMGQRLGIASALLGDPSTLILDEPVNGLDPDGVRWIRNLLRRLADEGRTVFLSSHLMSEMAVTAERVIVVGQGRLLRDQSMADFIKEASTDVVRVRSPQASELGAVLAGVGDTRVVVRTTGPDALEVEGLSSDQIGTTAFRGGFTLFELAALEASLEDAYMALTADSVSFRAMDHNDHDDHTTRTEALR